MSFTDIIKLSIGDRNFYEHSEKQLIYILNFRIMFLPVDTVIPLVGIYHKEIITSENKYVCICKDVQETIICNKETLGASLVVQWLRICLPMQGTRVRALVWEDPTCRGAARPVSHNY